jgi:hypothetical protein
MLDGRFGDEGLVGLRRLGVGGAALVGVRTPLLVLCVLVCVDRAGTSGFDLGLGVVCAANGEGFSATGESGGGGMSVPFVRGSSGASAGSSNFLVVGVLMLMLADRPGGEEP